jgi:hypothetical protein
VGSKFREISSRNIQAISVSGLDLGYYKHVDSTSQRETPQNLRRTEESKKKDLQKESYISQDFSKIDWNAFSDKNLNFQSIFILQTNVSMPQRESQLGRLKYLVSMDLQDNRKDMLVGQDNKGKSPQIINQTFFSTCVITTNAAPEAWSAALQLVRENKTFHPENYIDICVFLTNRHLNYV